MKTKIIAPLLLLLLSCGSGQKKDSGQNSPTHKTPVEYAEGFKIEEHRGYTSITIKNPWDSTRILQRYLLVDKNREVPGNLPKGTLIRTPISDVAVYTSVHCSMLQELGVADRITSVCEPQYINIPYITNRVKSGAIIDLGEASAPDIERVLDNRPEAIITSPLQNVGYGQVEKTGIPLIECTEYMENTPLAKAEWIRLLGYFFGQREKADSIFTQTASRYKETQKLVEDCENQPTILSEMKTGAVWYVPGGKSYMASLFNDAGAIYLWNDDNHTGSIPLAFEAVFEKAMHADIWLIKYNREKEMSYKDLKNEYSLFANFDAYKKQHIYTCNTGIVPYYEELTLHPDYVLKDLVFIFHPEVLPNYQPRYFKKMSE